MSRNARVLGPPIGLTESPTIPSIDVSPGSIRPHEEVINPLVFRFRIGCCAVSASLAYPGEPPPSASINAWFLIIIVTLLVPLANVERKAAVFVDEQSESLEYVSDRLACFDFDPKTHLGSHLDG
jgi:hypothetical protein